MNTKTRKLWIVALFLLAGLAGFANAANPVPLSEVTGPWLGLLKSGDAAVRNAAQTALVDIVRKHPDAASDLVNHMAAEENGDVSAEHERRLVPLAKDSPATVSALIRMMKEKGTNYRARNFGVKVMSQVGAAVGTPEFIDAMSETYCPVPGAFIRVMRAMGKDAAPILATAYRHPNANVRNRATIALRVIGRAEPTIQKLFNDLQAEGGLLLKLRDGTPADRIAALAALADMARTTPGTATLLVNAVKVNTDREFRVQAESHLVTLGRESPETIALLVSGVRTRDDYRLRVLAMKVLPKVGTALNTTATVEALGDHYCPVPNIMRRILIAAGQDALPVLSVAQKHTNPEIRQAAERILPGIPRPAAVVGTAPKQ